MARVDTDDVEAEAARLEALGAKQLRSYSWLVGGKFSCATACLPNVTVPVGQNAVIGRGAMNTRYARDTSNFDRAVGFFDAVYGFALTLLVTTIEVTDPRAWQSPGDLLAADGTQLLSFLISFIVIVVFWRQNHAMLARFAALDSATILTNVVVMAFVVFIPFTTEAMGDPDLQELPLPTALYAFNVGAAIMASIVMYEVGRRRGLVDQDESFQVRRARLLDALVAPVVMFLSIPVTYLGVALWGDSSAGKLFWLLLVALAWASGRWADRVARQARRDIGGPA